MNPLTEPPPSRLELLWESMTSLSGSEVVFFIFAALAVFSALATVSRRNPVTAAVWLVGTFFAVAVCYVLLSATFLAAIQVIVYAGAMMVLFVFVIMVIDVDESGGVTHKKQSRIGRVGYYGAVLLGVGFLTWVFAGTMGRQYTQAGPELPGGDGYAAFGSAESVGGELFTKYLFAFEAISLLLLAAVIGAVVVARTRRDREKEAEKIGLDEAARHAAGLSPKSGEFEATHGPTPYTDFGAPSGVGHEGGA